MTVQEAIKELSYDNTAYGGKCTKEVREMAIKALEKQIPKKPLKRLCGDCQRDCINCDRYEDRCPNCNGSLYIECGEPHKHCPHCGQKIDWEEGGTSD